MTSRKERAGAPFPMEVLANRAPAVSVTCGELNTLLVIFTFVGIFNYDATHGLNIDEVVTIS